MSATQLSDFARVFDEFGIPCIFLSMRRKVEWDAKQAVLRAVTEQLRLDLKPIEFLERWAFKRLALTARRPILNSLTISADLALQVLQTEQNKTAEKLRNLTDTTQIILSYPIRDIQHHFPPETACNPFEQPLTLIRRWTKSSHSPYSRAFGFQCSGWMDCKPAGTFLELEGSDALDLKHIRSHCENKTPDPTHWISFSDDVSWILKRVNRLPDPTTQVAIIDVRKLDLLNIPWQRSDILVQQRGGKCFSHQNPHGVNFAWAGHYLVYGWVPSQCVVATFDLRTFRQACSIRSVKEGSSRSYKTYVCVNIGPADISIRPPHILVARDEESTPVDELADAFQASHL